MGGAEQTIKKNRKYEKHANRKACRKRLSKNLTIEEMEDHLTTNYNFFNGTPTNTMDYIVKGSSQYNRYIRSRLPCNQKSIISLNRDNKYKL